jgi:hypothetical protein
MGKSSRQVQRYTAQLLELGLIAGRQHIQLVENWQVVWDHLAVVKGTAGKKQAAIDKLEKSRRDRKRARLLHTGEAVMDDEGNVAVAETGEIV